jgi:hypothetical protein
MDINSIHQIPEILINYLGKEFITRKVSGFNPLGQASSARHKLDTTLHPMYHDWYDLQLSIKESTSSGSERISRGATYLIRLAILLEKAKNVENINEIIERIKVKKTYHSSIFELEVLNFYLERNVPITVVKTSTIRTSDFVISLNDEQYCVEAKLLENTIFETKRKWTFVVDRISKLANKNMCCLHAHIKAYDLVENVNIEELCENIKHWSKLCTIPSELFEFSSSDGAYNLKVRCTDFWDNIKTYERAKPVEFPESPDNAISSFEGVFLRTPLGQTEVSNRISVVIEPFARLDFKSSIVSNLKTATKQSIANKPIIVHIGVPHTTSKDTFQIFETAIPQIHRYLKGNSKKIVGVVLESFSFDIQDDIHEINNNFIVIPNCSSDTDIPLPLTQDINCKNLPDEFNFKEITISLNMVKAIELARRNISANFAYFMSESGKIQFRIFTSDKYGGSLAFQKINLNHNLIDTQYIPLKHIKNSKFLKIDWEGTRLQIEDNIGPVKAN